MDVLACARRSEAMRVDGTRRGGARQAGRNKVRCGEQTERSARASSCKMWRHPSGTHQKRAISGVNLRCAASSLIKFYADFGKIMKFRAGFRHKDFGKIVKFHVEFRRGFDVTVKYCIEFRQG